MYKFKNVTITYDKELMGKSYKFKSNILMLIQFLMVSFTILACVLVLMLCKGSMLVTASMLSIIVLVFGIFYVGSKIIYNSLENIALHKTIVKFCKFDDIYAERFDDTILLRIADMNEVEYVHLNSLIAVSSVPYSIIDNSNNSNRVKINLHYSVEGITVTIERA